MKELSPLLQGEGESRDDQELAGASVSRATMTTDSQSGAHISQVLAQQVILR